MRLLHTQSFTLRTFITDIPPPYAILSHTWGDEEVTFKDITTPARERMRGWQKVYNSCRRAADDGWEYIWIDTCCIDKSDTTELSEAINSMFRWYEEAQICYAYLADVPHKYFPTLNEYSRPPWKWHFRSSRWFTRGWTLQELLAPTFLLFLDQAWGSIGSREDWADEICIATGIEVKQLLDFRSCCLATKLSWAADRQTTRQEDQAYSLLGLLEVNMPLIYGEGKRAFIRLQHELIRQYNDETIFAWGVKRSTGGIFSSPWSGNNTQSILATSAKDFMFANGLIVWPFDKDRRGFVITNAGLSINTELFEFPGRLIGNGSLYVIQLNCSWGWPPLEAAKSPMVLFLRNAQNEESSIQKQPVVFKKISGILTNWNEIKSSEFRSRGRHDILIMEERGPTRQSDISDIAINFKNASPQFTLGLIHRFYHDPWAETWKSVDTLDAHTRPHRTEQFQILLSKDMAMIVEVTGIGVFQEAIGVIVKWAPRLLSFGIWAVHRPVTPYDFTESMFAYLDSDQERPYPHSAVFDVDWVGRIAMIPEPVNPRSGTAQKQACLTITLSSKRHESLDLTPNDPSLYPTVIEPNGQDEDLLTKLMV